jgi:DnaJ domain
MFTRLILLVAFFIAAVTLIQLIKNTPKSQIKSLYWKLGLGSAAIVLVLLAVTGRVHWISAVIGAMLPFARRALPLLLRFLPVFQHYQKTRPRPQPSAGNSSQVQTAVLLMTLDHDNNHLTGEIIDGPFSGHSLDSIDLKQLQQVLDFCEQQDKDSVRLLISYLNHRFGNTWQSHEAPSPGDDVMNERAAYAILGLTKGATKTEVVKAHRKMIQKVHPDHGGSNYLAVQINQAKDLLIKRLT